MTSPAGSSRPSTHDSNVGSTRFEPGAWSSAFIVLTMCLATLPVGLTEGDAGEWMVIARHGGVPHPSGYPLFAILCRLANVLFASWLPLVSAVALVASLCTAGAAATAFSALRALGFASWPATVATLAVFGAGAVWRVGNMPEPFALNLLLASGVLWVVARSVGGHEGPRDALVLGCIFGLGLCNHHSLIWLVPLGLWAMLADIPSFARTSLRFAMGFALGLLPLFYLWLARDDDSPFDFYPLDDLGDLVRLVLRVHYGTFRLANRDTDSNWESLLHYGSHLPGWLSWVFLLVAVMGLVSWMREVRGAPRWRRRWFPVAWAASFVGASVIFFRMFNVPVEGWIASIVERFMALPTLLLLFPMAYGAERALGWLSSRRPGLVPVAVGVAIASHIAVQSAHADRRDETFYERHIHALFEIATIAGNAIVTTSDAETLGVMHGAYALELASEGFVWLNGPFWRSRRYRRGFVDRHGLPESYAELDLSGIVAATLRSRRRVAVTDLPTPPLPRAFSHAFVVGPATVLVHPDEPLPDLDTVWRLNASVFGLPYIADCSRRRSLRPWSRDLWKKYVDGLDRLDTVFRANGRDDLSQEVRSLRTALDCADSTAPSASPRPR